MKRVYLSPPDVGERERQLLLAAFDSNWIAPVGPDIDAFESEMQYYVGHMRLHCRAGRQPSTSRCSF
jgi:dTDP-4-amino-4,6-dideoxygalactose transaminase